MSLIIATVQGGNAILLTDGATYRKDAAIDRIGSKIITLPGVCGALAYEGRACREDIAAMAKGLAIRSALDLVQGLGKLASEMRDWRMQWHPAEQDADIFLCAAVYAPGVGPSLWVAWTGGEADRPGLTPGRERNVSRYCNYGDPSELLARPVDRRDPESFDPPSDGVKLAEVARSGPWDAHVTGHYVGGFLEMTTVGASGVTKCKLCHWPDKAGAPVDPTRPRRRNWFNSRR